MSYPVLHSFAGYSVYHLSKGKDEKFDWKTAGLMAILGNAPDFDFLPGLLAGEATRFHREGTHSILAGLAAGLLIALAAYLIRKRSFIKMFLMSSAAYFTHMVLDFMNGGHSGVPLFAPFSWTRYSSPVALMPGGSPELAHASGFGNFFAVMTDAGSLSLLCFEVLLVLSILGVRFFVKQFTHATRVREAQVMTVTVISFAYLWALAVISHS